MAKLHSHIKSALTLKKFTNMVNALKHDKTLPIWKNFTCTPKVTNTAIDTNTSKGY